MVPIFIFYFLIAGLDWLAVARGWKKVEYFAKPAAMILLLVALALSARGSLPLIFFAVGVFFSLLGDIFLLIPAVPMHERWFLPGLGAFLLAHVAYIAGLNIPLPVLSPLWPTILAVVLALTSARLLRRILAGVREKGMHKLVIPVGIYATVITLMLLSAFLSLYNREWNVFAAALVSGGAILFYFSDVVLAWTKFVNPVKNGRVINMVLYHLGQFGLAAGIIVQFGGK